jgi:hypothetical protein
MEKFKEIFEGTEVYLSVSQNSEVKVISIEEMEKLIAPSVIKKLKKFDGKSANMIDVDGRFIFRLK